LEPFENTASIKAVTQAIKDKKNRQRQHLVKVYTRRLIFLVLALIVGFGCYWLDRSDIFRIMSVSVIGNDHVTDQEIIELSEIRVNDRIWLTFNNSVKRKISASAWVADVRIIKNQNIITIEVTEHRILGYKVNDKISLLLQSGSLIALKESQLDWIATHAIISGFEEEDLLDKLVKSFADVDDSIMMFISEIHQSAVSYDSALIRLVMSDGNQIFTDFAALDLINEYKLIVNQISPSNKCIYFDALHRAYSSRPCEDE
jgi:cell division septal protein FtsQ